MMGAKTMLLRLGLAFLTAGLAGLAGQQGGAGTPPAPGAPAAPAQTAPAPAQNAPETKAIEEPPTFHTRVNLVMVPVVVRDKYEKIVGTLKQEDFRLSDKGKPQEIIKFSTETPTHPPVYRTSATDEMAAESEGGRAAAVLPERFVAYMFDDVNTSFGDLGRTRDAALRHVGTLGPKERAAVYTISGVISQEFTDDRDALESTIKRIFPHPVTGTGVPECPDISYYQADLIQNKNDSMALNAGVIEYMQCSGMDPTDQSQVKQAQGMVQGFAMRRLSEGEQQTRVALYSLTALIRRMATMPGQRIILLASAGFLTPTQQIEKIEVMDRAIKANVVIGTLDARGLYTDTPDISRPNLGNQISIGLKQQYDRESARAQADTLAEFAAGTGGTFFENNNDLYAGFQRIASAPDVVYLLGFSPQNLKFDGAFHPLKVTVVKSAGVSLNIQARKGYYAPRHLADPKETAREEISEALFSREEMTDLPVGLTTQYFKSGEMNARVTVLMHVDAKKLQYRKEVDRNCNELTIAAALFDRNGNYVAGNEKRLEMKLKDETLAKRLDNGLTVRSSFDVKPGSYMVRLVVRDAQGELMSATNGTVDIR